MVLQLKLIGKLWKCEQILNQIENEKHNIRVVNAMLNGYSKKCFDFF